MAGHWRRSILLLAAVFVALVGGRIKTAEEVDQDLITANAISGFSIKLAQEVFKEKPGNVIINPLGVATLLAELLQGVAKQSPTSYELQDALGRNVVQARSIGQIGREIQSGSGKTTDVLIGSKVFLAEGKKVTDRFRTILERNFYETTTNVDFNNPYQAANEINAWASRSTKGNVPTIVTTASISPDTRLVLGNAAYFKGVWESAFAANQTQPGWFTPSATKPPVSVWMMHQVGTLPAGQDTTLGAKWVRMAVDDKLAVIFIVPIAQFGLDEVIKKLTPGQIFEMAYTPVRRTVDLQLPRFSIESSNSMSAPLKRIGVRQIFQSDSYLNGIVIRNETLVVADVLHRAKLEVDEKGVTAAAVSAAVVNTLTLASYADDVTLVFNQPFLAIIADQSTGLPIFIARIANPVDH